MKLIATDLDGTLLNEEGQVSEQNAEAIKEALHKGIQVVVVSGRSYNYAKKPLQEHGITCPIICLNGAEIYSEAGQLVHRSPLHKSIAKNVIFVCSEEDIYIEVFTNKGGYSTSYERFLQVIVDVFQSTNRIMDRDTVLAYAEKRFQEENVKVISSFNELWNDDELEFYKVLAFSKDQNQLDGIRSKLDSIEELIITSSAHRNLEFNDPQAQKGVALSYFAKSIGISMDEVMAIGDNFNDVSMLTMAGWGVAMRNAHASIQEMCDFTTTTNIEHGVAVAIHKMLSDR